MGPLYHSAFPVPADDESVMPSLYFCQPHAQNQGMLRAIVSIDDCQYLVAKDKMTYVGEQFPKVYEGSSQSADFHPQHRCHRGGGRMAGGVLPV